LVNTIGTKKIVIGYDHRFGKDRAGGFDDLLKLSTTYGYDVVEIPEQDINDVAVSSTLIREALLNGAIELANNFLGYPFYITGKVGRGDQIGRTIGYPTANIMIEETYKLIPDDGIFSAKVIIRGTSYKGMAYIGSRPTINGITRNIEVNIFDFDTEIYGEEISMQFFNYVRGDVKFDGLEALKVQLAKDKDDVLALLRDQ
jgi:riboflavin kinase/FMN adenylyltransferase